MEDVAVTVSRGGYLKRTSVDTYRRQSRGGKGRIGMGTRSEDVVEHLVIASTHAYLLIFTNKGRVYWLKIYEIPDAGTTGKGKHISGLINLQPDETVKAFLPVKEFVAGKFIVMVTKPRRHQEVRADRVRQSAVARHHRARPRRRRRVAAARTITNGENFIFLGSHEGMAIRFNEDDVRAMGRQARGVRAMDLDEGDYLVGLEVVEEQGLILSISENGYGKRTPLEDYRLTARGRKGVINMKTTPEDRQGRRGALGQGRYRPDDHHQGREDHPARIQRDPPGGPLDAGRPAWSRMEEGDQVAAASCIPEVGEGRRHERRVAAAIVA